MICGAPCKLHGCLRVTPPFGVRSVVMCSYAVCLEHLERVEHLLVEHLECSSEFCLCAWGATPSHEFCLFHLSDVYLCGVVSVSKIHWRLH